MHAWFNGVYTYTGSIDHDRMKKNWTSHTYTAYCIGPHIIRRGTLNIVRVLRLVCQVMNSLRYTLLL